MSCILGKQHVCCTKIQNLTVKVGNETILNDLNLHLHCGELTAIIGRNGAGKTTFIKALLDVIPHSGTIIFESDNPTLSKKSSSHFTKTLTLKKPRFGYVPQSLSVDPANPVSVEDLVLSCTCKKPAWFKHSKKDKEKVYQILSSTHAESLIKKRVSDLSGGELQRVMLSLAVNPLPDILLLDEPVSGVDRVGLKSFYEMVSDIRHNYDITILLISHDLDLVAKHADRVLFINNSKASTGSVSEIYSQKDFIEVFGKINF